MGSQLLPLTKKENKLLLQIVLQECTIKKLMNLALAQEDVAGLRGHTLSTPKNCIIFVPHPEFTNDKNASTRVINTALLKVDFGSRSQSRVPDFR